MPYRLALYLSFIGLFLPILVGIIGAKYLRPFANFMFMAFAYQVVAVANIFFTRGFFRPMLLIFPYPLAFVVPCIVGAIASRRLGQFATFILVVGSFYVSGVLLVL